jgi:N-acetylglucosaminyl-diphospho-decaprenol L-rhamnosyltransferase
MALPALPGTRPAARPGQQKGQRLRLVQPVPQPVRLSVIVVNHCLWRETAQLIRQLAAATCTRRGEVEIVVVDNHSPAHPLRKAIRRIPSVSLRCWRSNRGFARAVNEGCRLSQGDWLLLLNPDITVDRGFLEGLLKLIERLSVDQPNTGIVGFQLHNTDGSRQLSSGPFPTLIQTLAGLLLPRHRRKYHFAHWHSQQSGSWVTGCCMLLRRQCLQELGGLDGDYFLYYEDVDLCRRAWSIGWNVLFEPGLRAIHHHPLHSRPMPAYFRLLTRHALLTYASKHWPGWQCRLLAALVMLEARWRRCWAQRRGDRGGADIYNQLRKMARGMASGRTDEARRLLNAVVRREEQRRE